MRNPVSLLFHSEPHIPDFNSKHLFLKLVHWITSLFSRKNLLHWRYFHFSWKSVLAHFFRWSHIQFSLIHDIVGSFPVCSFTNLPPKLSISSFSIFLLYYLYHPAPSLLPSSMFIRSSFPPILSSSSTSSPSLIPSSFSITYWLTFKYPFLFHCPPALYFHFQFPLILTLIFFSISFSYSFVSKCFLLLGAVYLWYFSNLLWGFHVSILWIHTAPGSQFQLSLTFDLFLQPP